MSNEQHFIYDLVSDLRRNPERLRAVEGALRNLDSVEYAKANGKASKRDITAAEARVVELSKFNFGLLIPRFFPRYPLDEPLDFSNRPFMFAMTAQAPDSVVTLKAGRQVGKCADGSTRLSTPAGSVTLKDLFDEGVPILL